VLAPWYRALAGFLCCFFAAPAGATVMRRSNPGLQELAAKFFAWRRLQQPISGDDIPRVERPMGWLPAFSPEDLAIYRTRYRAFLDQLSTLDRSGFSRADEVDALLLAAAIQRVGWELDVLRAPQRNPLFYLDQPLGSVFELLVLAPVSAGAWTKSSCACGTSPNAGERRIISQRPSSLCPPQWIC
jgi:hypothetical protein